MSRLKYSNMQGTGSRPLPLLSVAQSDYMLSANDESITYGDNGGILSPEARLNPYDKAALVPTVIPETSADQVANVLSPSARLNQQVQSQIPEYDILGVKTNNRSLIIIAIIIGAIVLAPRIL